MARLTIQDIQKMKDAGEPITMVTAYDATSARLAEQAEIPMLLVGDSLGMVVQGHESTVRVKPEQMVYHAEIVTRVTSRALVVGDLPFMSYKISPEQAMENAANLMQGAGVSAVKLEGGENIAWTVQRLVDSGIPVMGHIGLIPQSVNQLGGFRVQGRELGPARQLLRDALALEDAGAFAIVLELVPSELAAYITEQLRVPTIGIGAGPHTDGQVQVFHDLFGLAGDFLPRHAKQYGNYGESIVAGLRQYAAEVSARTFPAPENSFKLSPDVLAALRRENEADDYARHHDA
ncbi:MAG: 3-methyl-2-oxobutanoate hydroxymethyltransferase [Chloroflexi bacterium]|nr:3-methyl-2-oxobutanoate hydroxymethyltransferase [Chloroflexota bacterium]